MDGSFVALFAQAPHVRPPPTQKKSVGDIQIRDTCLTLIPGLEHCAMDCQELARSLDMLSCYLPEIEQLQGEQLEEGSKPNLHKGNVSLWIEKLGDPQVHPYSLFPVPDLTGIQINDLLRAIVEVMTADNGTLAMYHYQQQLGLSSQQLTDILTSNDIFWSGRPEHVAKLAFEFCRSNMLDQRSMIKQMILKMNDPESMMIFRDELRRTHSLLSLAFSQSPKKMSEYLSIENFKNDLKLEQVQLVQFLALKRLGKLSFQFELPTEEFEFLLPRVGRLCDMTSIKVGFSSALMRILFSQYPYFDIEAIDAEIRDLVAFADEDQMREYSIIVCSAVLWFDGDLPVVSAVLAHIVSKMREFPLSEFIDVLYNNVDTIDHFGFLVGELQRLGVFNYDRFWRQLIAGGYFRVKRERTSKIVCALPRLSRSNPISIRKELERDLGRLLPELNLTAEIDLILENGTESMEKAKQLPFLIRHLVSQLLIESVDNLCDACDILFELGTLSLIPDVLKRFPGAQVPCRFIPVVVRMEPLFSVRNALSDMVRATSNICNAVVEQKLVERLRMCPGMIGVDHRVVTTLVSNYSYLFSLKVFDALHGVNKPGEFATVFHTFCMDSLAFDGMDLDLFYQFFGEFCESNCITGTTQFFIDEFVSAAVVSHRVEMSEFLTGFFSRLFLSRVITPEYVLALALVQETEQLEMVADFVRVIISALSATIDNFTIHDILSERVVNRFSQKFQADTKLLSELVTLLRQLPSTIITKDMLSVILEPGTHYAAVIFSLLPEELYSEDFSAVFDYFQENVDTNTSVFWTVWMKLKPCYAFSDSSLLAPVTPDEESLAAYRHCLITAFSQLLGNADLDDAKTQLHLDCWNILASDPSFANFVVSSVIDDMNTSSLTLYPLGARIIHACLISLNEKPLLDTLCERLCSYTPSDDEFCIFAVFATSIFAVYVWKFTWEASVVPDIASKILEWVPKLYSRYCSNFEFVVDVFDFIIALTNTNQDLDFQETLHAAIRENLMQIPDDLQRLILLNYPPQTFRPPTLPFSEYDVPPEPESEPEPEIETNQDQPRESMGGAIFHVNTHDPAFDFDDMPDWMNVSFGL